MNTSMKLMIGFWMTSVAYAMSPGVSYAEGGSGRESGGGHGVEEGARVDFLDLREDADQPEGLRPFEPFHDADTWEAANLMVSWVTPLKSRHSAFTDALLVAFSKMKWFYSDRALRAVEDSDLGTPLNLEIRQVARQNEKGEVIVDKGLLLKMDTRNRAALFLHEAFLRKLGLKTPRNLLRKVLQAFASDSVDTYPLIAESVNAIHPTILSGEYDMKTQVAGLGGQGSHWYAWSRICYFNCSKEIVFHDVRGFHEFRLPAWSKDVLMPLLTRYTAAAPADSANVRIWVNGVLRFEGPYKLVSSKEDDLETVHTHLTIWSSELR